MRTCLWLNKWLQTLSYNSLLIPNKPIIYFPIIYFLFIVNWMIIALQNCASFCPTSTRISHRYNYVPSLWASLPLPSNPTPPLQVVTEHWFEFPELYSKLPLFILHMFPRYFLHSSHPLLPSSMSTSLFSMPASPLLPCKYVHQYHLSRFHIYVLIYLFFSFWLTSLCVIGSRFIHLIRIYTNAFLL